MIFCLTSSDNSEFVTSFKRSNNCSAVFERVCAYVRVVHHKETGLLQQSVLFCVH
jgi:hypothetical protein